MIPCRLATNGSLNGSSRAVTLDGQLSHHPHCAGSLHPGEKRSDVMEELC